MTDLKFYFDGTNGSPFEGEVSVSALISKLGDADEVGRLPFEYSDSFFSRSACSYNHKLALMSLGMTMSAFTRKNEGDKYIRSLLCDIGCDDRTIESRKFGQQKPCDDTCAYIFAAKRIPGDNFLIPVVIRSHRYGGEWVSNAHAVEEDCPDFSVGFKKAADGVYDALLSYIDRRGFDMSKLKIWVCGFSRGGAVSNLLGARLSFESGISKDNIFVYTFAAPLTVYDRRADFTDNIFNILSEMDAVPRLPLHYWGLRRYGTDLWLPCKARRGGEEYGRLLEAMRARFAEIMLRLGVEAEYAPLDDQEQALDLLFDYIDDLVEYPEKYRDGGYQELFMEYMQSKISGSAFEMRKFLRFLLSGNEEMADELCSLIELWHELNPLERVQRIGGLGAKRKPGDMTPATEIISMGLGILLRYAAKLTATKVTGGTQDYYYDQLVAMLVDVYHRGECSAVMQQHWPEAYLAWLKAAPEGELFRTDSYSRISIK